MINGPKQGCNFYWSLLRKVSWEKSLLDICKILRLFVSTLNADDKYFFLNIFSLIFSILHNKLRRNYLRNENRFAYHFLHFWNIAQILNISKKEMNFMTYVFPKLWTAKDAVTQMS